MDTVAFTNGLTIGLTCWFTVWGVSKVWFFFKNLTS